MLWRVLIVAGYTAAFGTVVWAATCGSLRSRRFIPIALAVSGTWVIFYVALLSGVNPLDPWLVSLARLGHVLAFTLGIFAGFALRAQGYDEKEHEQTMRRLTDELVELKETMRR